MLTIACAQYPIGKFDSVAAWKAHTADWIATAAGQGAELLLFPEYGAMELTSLLSEELQQDIVGQIAALQPLHQDFVSTYAGLAQRFGVHVVAPSLPVAVGDVFRNRSYIFAPDGRHGYQEKRQMTRFEREAWIIAGGSALKVFDIATKSGETIRTGIAICYDIEFPLIAQAMAAKGGADLILAPSCTDTLAGANRVVVGARARALENQVYVAVAPTVGLAEWSPAVDINVGWGGVFAAPDRGLPDDGILAQGELSQPGWVYAELDFAALRASRLEAQVFTAKDWPTQAQPSLDVAVVELK